jgi:Ca-activated chloride channel family protein
MALAMLWPLAAAVAADPPAGKTMLVMDASGSMWGKVDGDYKIVIARRVIAELMADWNPEIPLGLTAYGHNSKGSCSDIETLITPDTGTASALSSRVNRLNPRGKTPLTAAVVQAADTLDFEHAPASVILLSDGEETCGMDPCSIGASLEERGIDFTVYVIGFDVTVSDQVGLRCLAEETGGAFFAADNTEQLRNALVSVTDAIAASSGSLVSAGKQPGERINLSAFIAQDVPIVDGQVSWGIRQINDDGSAAPEDFLSITGNTVSARLPAGRFRVGARYGGAFKYLDVRSGPDMQDNYPVVFGAGRLRIAPLLTGVDSEADIVWRAYPLEIDQQEGSVRETLRGAGPVEFVLNEGLYRIRAELPGHETQSFDVLIPAGAVLERELAFEKN